MDDIESAAAPMPASSVPNKPLAIPRRYLLISRIGRKSLHPGWIGHGNDRSFDLFLSAYDTSIVDTSAPGIFFEHRPGRKVDGYAGLMRDHHDLLARYDYIAMFDEDLRCDSETLDRMFTICDRYALKIAQPSLSADSYFTYAGTVAQPGLTLRFVNYVEMMAPVFRRDVLPVLAPLYSMGYESGIDLIWCNLVYGGQQDFAIIDACSITHTEAVGSRKHENGFVDRRYEDDIHAILRRFGLPWLSLLPYAGITTGGVIIRNRALLFLYSLSAARALFTTALIRDHGRKLLVSWKHLLTGRARNIPIRWPGQVGDDRVDP